MHFLYKIYRNISCKNVIKNGPLCNRRKQAHPAISPEIVPSSVVCDFPAGVLALISIGLASDLQVGRGTP